MGEPYEEPRPKVDYYDALEVDKNASLPIIKKSYKYLANIYHSDKPTADEEKFKEIGNAYEVIGDKEKRKKYDLYMTNKYDKDWISKQFNGTRTKQPQKPRPKAKKPNGPPVDYKDYTKQDINYYEILEIKENDKPWSFVRPARIERAHFDMVGSYTKPGTKYYDTPDDEKKIALDKIEAAYYILKDPSRKALYDTFMKMKYPSWDDNPKAAKAAGAKAGAGAGAGAGSTAAEEAARRKAAEEAARQRAAEAEAKRKAAEAEAKRKAAEAEAKRKAAEAEAKRKAAEAEAKKQAAKDARRRADETARAAAQAAEEADAAEAAAGVGAGARGPGGATGAGAGAGAGARTGAGTGGPTTGPTPPPPPPPPPSDPGSSTEEREENEIIPILHENELAYGAVPNREPAFKNEQERKKYTAKSWIRLWKYKDIYFKRSRDIDYYHHQMTRGLFDHIDTLKDTSVVKLLTAVDPKAVTAGTKGENFIFMGSDGKPAYNLAAHLEEIKEFLNLNDNQKQELLKKFKDDIEQIKKLILAINADPDSTYEDPDTGKTVNRIQGGTVVARLAVYETRNEFSVLENFEKSLAQLTNFASFENDYQGALSALDKLRKKLLLYTEVRPAINGGIRAEGGVSTQYQLQQSTGRLEKEVTGSYKRQYAALMRRGLVPSLKNLDHTPGENCFTINDKTDAGKTRAGHMIEGVYASAGLFKTDENGELLTTSSRKQQDFWTAIDAANDQIWVSGNTLLKSGNRIALIEHEKWLAAQQAGDADGASRDLGVNRRLAGSLRKKQKESAGDNLWDEELIQIVKHIEEFMQDDGSNNFRVAWLAAQKDKRNERWGAFFWNEYQNNASKGEYGAAFEWKHGIGIKIPFLPAYKSAKGAPYKKWVLPITQPFKDFWISGLRGKTKIEPWFKKGTLGNKLLFKWPKAVAGALASRTLKLSKGVFWGGKKRKALTATLGLTFVLAHAVNIYETVTGKDSALDKVFAFPTRVLAVLPTSIYKGVFGGPNDSALYVKQNTRFVNNWFGANDTPNSNSSQSTTPGGSAQPASPLVDPCTLDKDLCPPQQNTAPPQAQPTPAPPPTPEPAATPLPNKAKVSDSDAKIISPPQTQGQGQGQGQSQTGMAGTAFTVVAATAPSEENPGGTVLVRVRFNGEAGQSGQEQYVVVKKSKKKGGGGGGQSGKQGEGGSQQETAPLEPGLA